MGMETFGGPCSCAGSVPTVTNTYKNKLYTVILDFSMILQLCLTLVAMVLVLNTSSTPCFNEPTSCYGNKNTLQTAEKIALLIVHTEVVTGDAAQYHCRTRGVVTPWCSAQSECLSLTPHTHRLHPVQWDCKFTETKGLPLMCGTD